MSRQKDTRRIFRVSQALTLKDFREAVELTQPQLADAVDIPLRTISRIEQAERAVTSPELETIAEALKVTPEQINLETRRRIADGEIPSDADRAADVFRSNFGD